MPMYQYACDACGFEFERVQSFHDEPLTDCPECAGRVRRVIAPVGVIFKGSGWYITDSRRQITGKANGGKPGTAESAAGSASDSASDSAGDAADKATKSDGDSAAATKTAKPEKSEPTPA